MPKNVQYAIAGVVALGAIWLVVNTYNSVNAPANETRDSIQKIDEALDRAQPSP